MAPIERDLIRRARSGETIPPQDLSAIPTDNLWNVVKRLRHIEQKQGDIFYAKVRKQGSAA
jgi:hypothetical protein